MSENTSAIHDFRIDLKSVITLLAKHLYSDTDVFVRELLQNAHDAIVRRRMEEGVHSPPGAIRVAILPETREISFIDNGAGLTETEIHQYLATIGRSGTRDFRLALIEKGRDAEATLIGKFGIGLLSAFVVADKVEVETRSFRADEPLWRWSSTGDKTYLLDRIEGKRHHNPLLTSNQRVGDVGTVVTLTVSDNQPNEMLNADYLRSVIRKYADFMQFPIFINDESTPANSIVAPWGKTYASRDAQIEEYRIFLDRRFPEAILHVLPVDLPTPLRVRGALFISNRVTIDFHGKGSVDVYQSGMYVQSGNREILPPWAKFVGGVIDSPDLTLTLSREGISRDPKLQELQQALGQLIVDEFKLLAQRNPSKLQKLLDWHGMSVKTMALADDEFFLDVIEMIPFETNRGKMDLQTYFKYSSLESDHERQILRFTQENSAILYFLLADKQGLVVINCGNSLDEKLLQKYSQVHNISLKQMTDPEAGSVFSPILPDERAGFSQLEVEFRRILPNSSRVEVVRFQPSDMPALIMETHEAKVFDEIESAAENVAIPDSIGKLLQAVLSTKASLPSILYINADNSSIKRLLAMDLRSEIAQQAIGAIYSNSLLLTTHVLTRQKVEDTVHQYNQIVDLLISKTMDLEQMKQTKPNTESGDIALTNHMETTPHVTCFVAMPFSGFEFVMDALKEVFEDKPNFWQVVRADEEQLDPTIYGSVYKHIGRAHLYVAEISDHNFNVGMELGMMQQYYDRPKILLRRSDAKPVPADLHGAIYVSYASKSELMEQLREQLRNNHSLRQIASDIKYLSPVVLNRFGFDYSLGEALARDFSDAEAFVSADIHAIARKHGLSARIIQELQDEVRRYYGFPSIA